MTIEKNRRFTYLALLSAVAIALNLLESIYIGPIFGVLRQRNRRAAYIVSALCFAIAHVAPYAALSPVYWLYLIQYIPAALLLARCYERSSCIWCSIFFHMLNNGVALSAASLLM